MEYAVCPGPYAHIIAWHSLLSKRLNSLGNYFLAPRNYNSSGHLPVTFDRPPPVEVKRTRLPDFSLQ